MTFPGNLLIQCQRVICRSTGHDSPTRITVHQGLIDHLEPARSGGPLPDLDFHDAILLPGLIDLHAHPACQGSVWGVIPDQHMLPFGVTTVMSQGDAGADNWNDYQDHTIEASRTRVLMAMNPSAIAESTQAGCFEEMDNIDIDRCIHAIHTAGDRVRAVSVNTSRNCCGDSDPREVLGRGLLVAEETSLPLLYGMRPPEDWSFREQMELLRPGDIVTYCFRSQPHNIVARGTVHPAIREARKRGILFDVGHGGAAFDFEVASAAIAEGFLPDTISTDLHVHHLQQAVPHTLPRTMSKLRAAGMESNDIFTAVTTQPATILRSPETLGCLRPGASADLVVLQTSNEPVVFSDTHGNQRKSLEWIPVCTVRQGEVIHLADRANTRDVPPG